MDALAPMVRIDANVNDLNRRQLLIAAPEPVRQEAEDGHEVHRACR